MKILPESKVQTLAECELGQLVRSLEYGEADHLGVVFDTQGPDGKLRGIVTLTSEEPTFETDDQPDQFKVLAYSGELVWETDQLGPSETRAHDIFNRAGVVICSEDGWVLNVVSLQGLGFRRSIMQLNLSSNELRNYQERIRKVAMFGAWAVYLEEKGRPFESRIKIASFDIGDDKKVNK